MLREKELNILALCEMNLKGNDDDHNFYVVFYDKFEFKVNLG